MEALLYFFKIFTDEAHHGNPAGCVLLEDWPDSHLLQSVASEANQVVTAFIVPVASASFQYQIRWFSQVQEINLCGHGTLAAAALLRQLKGEGCYLFVSPYGHLEVKARAECLEMRLPLWPSAPAGLPSAFAAYPVLDVFHTRDLVVVLANEHAVQQFVPDFELIKQLGQHALILTAFVAPETYVLRYFAPTIGINEDIATGSAQCSLVPYWAEKTGLTEFKVRQLAATPAGFSVSLEADQLRLQTQAVALPNLTRALTTKA
jgi:predicted PhzF superfamily epimerase YddE/YHI9